MRNEIIFDRIRGALHGVAVGDALGAPVEFMSAAAIKQKHGRLKDMTSGGWLNVRPGEITDDTQMTLCVARGIAESPEDPVPAIGKNFIEWFGSAPKDVGTTCAVAIGRARKNIARSTDDWLRVGRQTDEMMSGNTAGNGALMRTIYPAVYYADKGIRRRIVELIGAMTHYHTDSRDICKEYADAVHAAIFGGHPICTISRQYYRPGATPTGYVVHTWSNVIEAILNTETFEEAVIEAVNRGGDADTIGAITGGLAGAYYGYNSIPDRWIETIDSDIRKELDELAETAYSAMETYYHGIYRVTI